MRTNLFGNPHSASPSSALSTVRVEDIRSRILRFFKADPEHFDLVFVANATAAIKLILDAFRDVEEGFWYGYHRDAHTSIVGVRQLAKESRCFASNAEVEEWIEEGKDLPYETSLFAYPAQSNMNGHRTPLDWPGRVRKSSSRKIYTLLDAAAYVMTAPLDLSDVESAPDFTALSFYKIFGFPDLGALIVRKSAGDILRRRKFFGGGTVDMVIALQKPWHAMKEHSLHEQLEDGTLPFHHIVALDSALNVFSDLFGSMENVSRHTCALAMNLFSRLSTLRHSNGRSICHFYKDPDSQYGNAKTQGPTLALNLVNAEGGWIGKSDVERLAILHGIHLRTGGVCNPGGIANFCNLQAWEMRRNFSEGMRCGDDLDILGGKPTGIVRVSFGAMSSIDDVDRFVEFVQDTFVETWIDPLINPCRAATEEFVIKRLQVFPVVGCAGWEIPSHLSWPVGSSGLEWDREWCIVSQETMKPLDPQTYSAMRSIRPHLNSEQGTLRLIASKSSSSNDASEAVSEDGITISLWDTPSNAGSSNETGLSTADVSHRPFDVYPSKSISSFLTTIIGVPCALARFQHSRKVAKEHHQTLDSRPTYPLIFAPHPTVSISFSDAENERQVEAESNITLKLPSQDIPSDRSAPYINYLRIRDQVFGLLDPPTINFPSGWHMPVPIKHLSNSKSRNISSQNPTISTNQGVQFYTKQEAQADPNLYTTIISTFSCAAYPCPIWHCRRPFSSASGLESHLHTHIRKIEPQTRPGITPLSAENRNNSVSLKKKISHKPSPSTSTTSTTSTTMSGLTVSSMESTSTTATEMSVMNSTEEDVKGRTKFIKVVRRFTSSTPALLELRMETKTDNSAEMKGKEAGAESGKTKRRWDISVKGWKKRVERVIGCA
jgi:molybdenum cofactor sulfurtransferase